MLSGRAQSSALAAARTPWPAQLRGSARRLQRSLAAAAAAAPPSAGSHYAVVGAGLAGVATAYHLLKLAERGRPVHVTLVDAVGIGAGGSGAAAGLLHPFTAKGKLLWRAPEAMAAALELLEAAEATAAAADAAAASDEPLAWRTGMLRTAGTAKQSQDYWRLHGSGMDTQQPAAQQPPARAGGRDALLVAALASASRSQQLLPGLRLPVLAEPGAQARQQQPSAEPSGKLRRRSKQQAQAPAGWSPEQAAALHVPGGITLHPLRYLHALWAACQALAAARRDGSSASLHIRQLGSLQELASVAQRPLSAVVVAAGAAVGSLAELAGALPLDLCQGYTLDLLPPPGSAASAAADDAQAAGAEGADSSASSSSTTTTSATGVPATRRWPAGAPSLLGSPYLASQGGRVLVAGATKQHGLSAQQALRELGRSLGPDAAVDGGEAAAAASELLAGAAAAWPAIASWRIGSVRTGVRALPPRSPLGSVPLLGRWPLPGQKQQGGASREPPGPPTWLCVGLGARGLVYHAWLGQMLAQAVLAGDEDMLPRELRAWQGKV